MSASDNEKNLNYQENSEEINLYKKRVNWKNEIHIKNKKISIK